jgi:hypothetical protein
MTAIRSAAPIVRRPVVKAAAVQAAAPVATAKPVAKPEAKPQVVKPQATEWTTGRILKTAGMGVGGFVGGNVATFVVDLFFHFGNNGGTAWPGGIYLAAAGLAAAGAMALYNHLSQK